MKKTILFLMGILLSFNSYGLIDSNKENQLGENLKVDVKINIPKTNVKYVTYASLDNGATMSDTLELPDFILSQNSAVAGFVDTPISIVYTKKIVDGQKVDLGTEKVFYEIKHPDGFFFPGNDKLGPEGRTSTKVPTTLLPKSVLEDIVKILGKDYRLNEHGNIVNGPGDAYYNRYAPAVNIVFHTANGTLDVKSVIYTKEVNCLPIEDVRKIEAYLKNKTPIADIFLEVTIE